MSTRSLKLHIQNNRWMRQKANPLVNGTVRKLVNKGNDLLSLFSTYSKRRPCILKKSLNRRRINWRKIYATLAVVLRNLHHSLPLIPGYSIIPFFNIASDDDYCNHDTLVRVIDWWYGVLCPIDCKIVRYCFFIIYSLCFNRSIEDHPFYSRGLLSHSRLTLIKFWKKNLSKQNKKEEMKHQ